MCYCCWHWELLKEKCFDEAALEFNYHFNDFITWFFPAKSRGFAAAQLLFSLSFFISLVALLKTFTSCSATSCMSLEGDSWSRDVTSSSEVNFRHIALVDQIAWTFTNKLPMPWAHYRYVEPQKGRWISLVCKLNDGCFLVAVILRIAEKIAVTVQYFVRSKWHFSKIPVDKCMNHFVITGELVKKSWQSRDNDPTFGEFFH